MMSSTPSAGLLAAPRTLSLDSAAGVTWTVQPASPVPAEWASIAAESCPATVPGEVHVDLLTAGLIPDPFDGDNELRLAWIGRTDWSYRATFEWAGSDHARTDLVADGLDTVATIRLNGREVGATANQHRSYRFAVTDALVAGTNELEVTFAAPVAEAQRRAAEIGDRPHVNPHPFNAIRKAAYSYGWDWGPDLAGVGIWKSLRLESWSVVRLGTVRPLASLDGPDGILEVHAELEWAAGQDHSRAMIDGPSGRPRGVGVGSDRRDLGRGLARRAGCRRVVAEGLRRAAALRRLGRADGRRRAARRLERSGRLPYGGPEHAAGRRQAASS